MTGGNDGPSANQAPGGWVFKGGDLGNTPQPDSTQAAPAQNAGSIEWTASEYVAHQKHTGWFVQVGLATVVVSALVYIITRDVISTVVILFAGLVFAVTGARKPKVLAFRVDPTGLTIGQRYYPYIQFKSFVVTQEGPLVTVAFMSTKRFIPSVDIFVPPENADAILEVLSNSLPLETRKPGMVDTFVQRIRF